ncbi:MAG: hypothetical protein JWR69_4393 [Pedosphaera sp.]|nr:hypothetical protein [Pedosphaera sp.]
MKSPTGRLLGLAVSALWLLGSHSSCAAVGLSISPAIITNDYSGNVTLTITGLTNNQPVQAKRFYDLNGNGTIDAGQDFVVQAFTVTDGQLPKIGGVRNLNVPGDDDGATNGQIQTLLDYPGLSSVVGGMTGNFIFKLEDENGATLATQVFSVAQKVRTQGVRGCITSAATSLPVTNTPVALATANGSGNPVLTLTDPNGNYTLYAPTGSYVVLVLGGGFVSDQNAGFVTVQLNQLVTNNLALASGTYTISGTLTDASSGKQGGAVFVNAESTNNLFSGAFADTNGNFSFPVTPGQWKVKLDQGALAQRSYLSPQNNLKVTVTNSSITNLNFALSKATALIYGTVKDGLSNGVSGLSLRADDGANLFEADGASNTNGAYTLAVVAGNWNVGPDSDSLIARGYSGGSSTNVTVSDGQAVQADFILQGVTAHLRGQVKDDDGNAITNITIVVQPYPIHGNGANSVYPTTDGSGNFDVGVHGGAWNLALECVSAENRGYVNISGINYTVTDGVDQNGLVLTFPQSTAVITGKLTDPVGNPIVGVELDANQAINAHSSYFPGCVSTDNNGNYQIKVLAGSWSVNVRNNELNALGYGSISGTNVTISAGAATANFVAPVTQTAPQFTAVSYSPSNGISLTLTGDVAHTNTIQFSTNLVAWFPLTNTILTNATWHVTDRAATNQPRRFYRAIAAP